jgi:ketosteroid isomerase-like protein
MPDESTTSDQEELAQRLEDAIRAGDDDEALKALGLDLFRSLYAAWEHGGYDDGINADLNVVMRLHADEAVYDMSAMGLDVLEGQAAIRGLYEDWRSSYEAFEAELEELRDLGHGVTFSVVINRGRLHGSAHWIELRFASVGIWAGGRIERGMGYTDIGEARAAAERLAEERAKASD